MAKFIIDVLCQLKIFWSEFRLQTLVNCISKQFLSIMDHNLSSFSWYLWLGPIIVSWFIWELHNRPSSQCSEMRVVTWHVDAFNVSLVFLEVKIDEFLVIVNSKSTRKMRKCKSILELILYMLSLVKLLSLKILVLAKSIEISPEFVR